MSGQEWTQIRAMFDDLADLDDQRRSERLAVIRSTDPRLASKLAELLAADGDAESALAHLDVAIARALPVDDRAEDQQKPDPLNLVGRSVSHFRVIEPLAAGGMGVVYRAEDTKLQRIVALKFPLPTFHLDRGTKERFLHEARSAGALEHNNICSIHAIGETDDGHVFLAMPYYDGETLKARLARERTLDANDAIAIAKQIALGLSAAHNAGIVHRDVKPANVMVLPNGSVKVLDFGLAKVRDLTLSAPGARMGTVAYMSPEQIQGHAVDERTDLWALGVILYEMLGGRRPFSGDYDVSVAHVIVHGQPIGLSALRSDLAPQLEALVSKLLSKDPAARYASAEEVVLALAGPHMQDAPQRHLAPGIRVRPRWRTRTSTRTAVALTALVVIGVLAWSLTHKGAVDGQATPPTLIVLPFTDSSGNPNDAYLVTGLSDGIGTELSRLRSVIVPRASAMYENRRSTKSMPQIATELGASAAVEGAMQRTGDRLHVSAHLIDVQSGQRLWEKVYDRPMKEMLGVQREATEAIIAALKLHVTKSERAVLARPPTANPEAYDLFLRGRDVELRGRVTPNGAPVPVEFLRDAQSFYSRARDLDPTFAGARARLGLMHILTWQTHDSTTARREQARLEAEAALRIAPTLGEGHEALAHYWNFGRGDDAKAIAEIILVLDGFPNDVAWHRTAGQTYRRLGLWEDAITQFDRAMQVAPLDAGAAYDAGTTYNRVRRYKQAVAAWDRVIALGPKVPFYKMVRGYIFIRWLGTADTLAAVMKQLPATWDDDGGMGTWARCLVARIQHRNADALEILNSSKHQISFDDYNYRPRVLLLGQVYDALGERARAQSNYEASRALLVDSIAVHPRDERMHIALGLTYAGLNRKREAADEARRALELVPLTKDNPKATAVMGGAAEVFAQAGEANDAIEKLELLLAMPAGREVSVPQLRVDPAFDRLRGDPRFEQLLNRFATP